MAEEWADWETFGHSSSHSPEKSGRKQTADLSRILVPAGLLLGSVCRKQSDPSVNGQRVPPRAPQKGVQTSIVWPDPEYALKYRPVRQHPQDPRNIAVSPTWWKADKCIPVRTRGGSGTVVLTVRTPLGLWTRRQGCTRKTVIFSTPPPPPSFNIFLPAGQG